MHYASRENSGLGVSQGGKIHLHLFPVIITGRKMPPHHYINEVYFSRKKYWAGLAPIKKKGGSLLRSVPKGTILEKGALHRVQGGLEPLFTWDVIHRFFF